MSSQDLADLAVALEARGVFPLHVTYDGEGFWRATFETADQHAEPGPNIAVLVAAVESLGEAERAVWSSCSRCEFNIGCECEAEATVLNHSLSPGLLARVASVGASLGITVYPHVRAT